ncbi:MAG: TlpA disulfide reductase family protein [Pseudomonadota bacterium]|nr:TlpA disulfide reductase family protein [Pseudomonadota bacterium]
MRVLAIVFSFLFATTGHSEPVDYSLPDLNGKDHSLADYRGKWVIVNYWATWCTPCQEEIPDLVEFHDRHKNDDAVVIGVNFEDIGGEQLKAFVDSFLISYPILRSEPLAVTPLGPVPGLPTTYIITPDGSPVARQVGPVTAKQLDDYITRKKTE